MDSTERHIQTWMVSGRGEEIDAVLADVSSAQSSLLNVVKALGEYLTSEEEVLRTKGVDFLSTVISRCPADAINRQATRTLSTFLEDKLEDPATTVPALKGLVTLTAQPTFSGADAVKTATALFAHLNMKAQNPSTRHMVYKILDIFLANYRTALQGMGGEFLTGYRKLLDGEKDPRNLMLIFQMDRVICIEFDISEHIEEFFDIIFCYFPISFRPPKEDPYGITPDELRFSLRSCMSASPFFGELAIKLFLDKLLAGSPSTKKDTLETLVVCLPLYGAFTAAKFAKQLWNTMKLEIFQPVNPEIEAEALNATEALIKTMYADHAETEGSRISMDFVTEMCEECLSLMDEPEKSQAVPASKVIAALLGTTPKVSDYVLSQAIPRLVKLHRDPGESVHRPQILTLLCVTTAAFTSKPSHDGQESPLLSYKDDILSAFISGLSAISSREASLEGLKKLSQVHLLLSDEELAYIVRSINEILQPDNENENEYDASDDALDVLCSIADKNSKIIEEYTLPILFSALPDIPPPSDAHAQWEKNWRTLRRLSRLCIPAPLFETLAIRLSTKLDIICAPKTVVENMNVLGSRAAYAHSLLRTLGSVMELKVNAKHPDIPKYIDRLIPGVFNLFVFLSQSDSELASETRLHHSAGEVITLVVRTLSSERQKRLASELYALYFEGSLNPLATGHQLMPEDRPFRPFNSSSSPFQRNTIVLLAAAIVAFQKEIWLPNIEPLDFLMKMQTWCLHEASDNSQREAANHIISTLLNKNAEIVGPFITRQSDFSWFNELEHPPVRKAAVENWLWIVRALVALNHNLAGKSIDSLFALLGDQEIGLHAARAIGRAPSTGGILTKQNNAQLRMLYPQRYFQAVLPRIFEGLRTTDDTFMRKAYLTALTSLVSSLPKMVYISDMRDLMPYLIQGLELRDDEIRKSIINTLSEVAGGDGLVAAQDHASTLASVMLSIALSQDNSSVDLRVAALRFLTKLPKTVRYDVLHPQKKGVIRDLGKVLDDPRRAVRKEAVNARTAWYLYNG